MNNNTVLQKNNHIFIINKSNSVLVYSPMDKYKQCILFNRESSHHYKQFDLFVQIIKNSSPSEYDSIVDIYTLAAVYNVGAVCGHIPK